MAEGQRKAYNVKWDRGAIKGDALLFVYDPGEKRWVKKKDGKNDGAMVVTFPPNFKGERDCIIVGSEGGLANIHIEVE
jgi:hypothetical protein